jgi:hypothetical protein
MLSSVGCTRNQIQIASLKTLGKKAHRKYVEAGAEVKHDRDIPVPCCLLLGKLDCGYGMPGLSGTLSAFHDGMSLSLFCAFEFDAPHPVETNFLSSRSMSRNVDAVHDPEAITTRDALMDDPSASVTPDVLPSCRIRPVTALPLMTLPPKASTRDIIISTPRVAKTQPESRLR